MKKIVAESILIIIFFLIGFFVYSKISPDFTMQLLDVEGGSFVESAGYYEGALFFSSMQDAKEYSVFVCSETWDWVEEGNCYIVDEEDIAAHVESHIQSSKLSGCFVGGLEGVACSS